MTYVCDFCFVLNFSISSFNNQKIFKLEDSWIREQVVHSSQGFRKHVGQRGYYPYPRFCRNRKQNRIEQKAIIYYCWAVGPPRFLDLPPPLVHTYYLKQLKKKTPLLFCCFDLVSSCSYEMTAPVLKPKICFSTETMPQCNYKWRFRFLFSCSTKRITRNSMQLHLQINIYFCQCKLWQYRLWSFKARDTKLERFLPKNQDT